MTYGRVSHLGIFLKFKYIYNLEQILSLHPNYYSKFFDSTKFIMTAPGLLPFHIRYYIAIMVPIK